MYNSSISVVRPNLRTVLFVAGLALAAYGFRAIDLMALRWAAIVLVTPALSLAVPRRISHTVARLDRLFARRRATVAGCVFLASFAYFLAVALAFRQPLFPVIHDEQMHAVQVRLLSTGRLWTASHPMADFFETFHVLARPVYAPMHFPGTALLNVVKVWLGLPWCLVPLLLTAGGCAMTYLVVAELCGDAGGLLATSLVWAAPTVRSISTMLLSHNAMLGLGPFAVWAYLRWRTARAAPWAVVLGGAVGWMAITRPVDAIAFTIPIGVAVLVDAARAGRVTLLRSVLWMVAAASPFLGLQLAFDKGVTGQWFTPPYQYYNDTAFPLTSYAGERPTPDASAAHVSDLAQRQDYYEQYMLQASRNYVRQPWGQLLSRRGAMMADATLPDALLWVLLPAGLYAVTRSLPAFVVGAPALLLFGMYLPSIFFDPHYAVVAITPVAALVVLGTAVFPPGRGRRFAYLAIAAAAVTGMPPLSTLHSVEFVRRQYPAVLFTHETLPRLVRTPALVLFRYGPGINYHDEPVYNTDTADPDDAAIVLAQSLGGRNFDLVHYYRSLGQNRYVYEVDRQEERLQYVGRVNDIDAHRPTDPSTIRPATRPTTRP